MGWTLQDKLAEAVEMVRQLAAMGVVEAEFHPDGTLYRCRLAPRQALPVATAHPLAASLDRKVSAAELNAAADEQAKREFEATAFAATEGVKPRHWKG